MNTLRLHTDYLQAVIDGRKTTTVRAGKRNMELGPCRIVAGRTSLDVTITDIRHCRYDELTDEDAIRDGFNTLSELKAALHRFYPNLTLDAAVSVVRFERSGRIADE